MADVHAFKQKAIVRLSQYATAKRAIDGIHRFKMRQAREQLQVEGYAICQDVCRSLGAEGITCFALSGTLLGLVRDGRFIEYDDDIDLAVVVDGNFDWSRARQAMERAGCHLWREFGFDSRVTEQAYRRGKLGIDLFAQFPCDDGYRMFFYTYEGRNNEVRLHVKYLDQPEPGRILSVQFEEHEINIPTNAESYLEANYGPGWRIPDPDYVAGSRWRYLDSSACFVRYEG